MNYIDNPHFYIYKCSPEKREETKKRLTQIKELGMEICGVAQFGIKDIMSGLYIEMVWSKTDDQWDDYINYVKELIKNKNNIIVPIYAS